MVVSHMTPHGQLDFKVPKGRPGQPNAPWISALAWTRVGAPPACPVKRLMTASRKPREGRGTSMGFDKMTLQSLLCGREALGSCVTSLGPGFLICQMEIRISTPFAGSLWASDMTSLTCLCPGVPRDCKQDDDGDDQEFIYKWSK